MRTMSKRCWLDRRMSTLVLGCVLACQSMAQLGAGVYPFGFQGLEAEDELKETGNTATTYFRWYDARLAQWISEDPRSEKYPGNSPYVALGNNPVHFTDPRGDTIRLRYNASIQGEVEDFVNWLSAHNPDAVMYQIDNDRLTYEIHDAEELTQYDRTMISAIDDPSNVNLRLTFRNRQVLFDSYRNGQVDIADFGQGDLLGPRMTFFHIIAERFARPGYERRRQQSNFRQEFRQDHRSAFEEEAQVYRELLGDPSIQFQRHGTNFRQGYSRVVFRSTADPSLQIVRQLAGVRPSIARGRITLDNGGASSRIFILRNGQRTPIADVLP